MLISVVRATRLSNAGKCEYQLIARNVNCECL